MSPIQNWGYCNELQLYKQTESTMRRGISVLNSVHKQAVRHGSRSHTHTHTHTEGDGLYLHIDEKLFDYL